MPARSRNKATTSKAESDVEKENRSRLTRARSKSHLKLVDHPIDTYCLCNQPDDGSPMVLCAECSEWYHFRCVELDAEQAEDLEVYVCPICTETTGRRMIMKWEQTEAHPNFINHDDPNTLPKRSTPPPALSPSESEDTDSEDDYVAEPETAKRKPSRRRTRQVIYATDSDEDHLSGTHSHVRNPSTSFSEERRASPGPATHLKRKSAASHQARETKRKKPSDAPVSVDDDPARKYCLAKLRDMLRPVFFRYPHADADDGSGKKVDLNADHLTDEDKQRLQDAADGFSSELEQSLFDLYGEPDKYGKLGVGPKYKERFRMLIFNLSQEDRVAIHKRICFSTIAAKELSQMSSTDLANEETKQSIKLAEKEALEHSILQKTLIPRAKITHKGLQDIEYLNGESATLLREREKEREKEDDERRGEERRGRERQARLKAAEQHRRDRAGSISQASIPPESPIVPQSATWGGPLPAYRDSYSPPVGENAKSPIHPLFAPSTSVVHTSPEPELDIADLIHLDDELAPQDTFADLTISVLEPSVTAIVSDSLSPPGPAPPPPPATPPPACEASPLITTSPTQLVEPETPVRTSFDLTALWTSPKAEPASREIDKEPEQKQQLRSQPIEVNTVAREATDQDFDMFLEKDQDADLPQDKPPQDPEIVFQAAPLVWTGKVAMPVDSSTPQLAPAVARQIGGRTLGADSPLWRTLFPSDTLRIDGRVPTENSAQFLLQTRLNPQKELIACAFSSEGSDSMLQTFSDFLLQKNRHGLVFPWGHHPKDYHPGKELYMVPLLASSPLPDFIELLDDLRLPHARQNNYVIGIWILAKGKLVLPPILPPAPPPPSLVQPHPQPLAPPPAPVLPAVLQAYPQLANSALAAEVAALTPEQIQAILRTLSSGNGGIAGISGGLANAVANVAHAPIPPAVPPSMPTAGSVPASIVHGQPHWSASGIPGFGVPQPPHPHPHGVVRPGLLPGSGPATTSGPGGPHAPVPGATPFMAPPHLRTPPHHGSAAGIQHQPPSGPRGGAYRQARFDRDDGPDARYHDERTGAWQTSPNGRGPGRPRGRGRGRGGAGGSAGEFVGRPVDAGWARRSQGSPGQEDRARWDGPSPPRRWG